MRGEAEGGVTGATGQGAGSRGITSLNDTNIDVVSADHADNGGLDNEHEGRAIERLEPFGPGDT